MLTNAARALFASEMLILLCFGASVPPARSAAAARIADSENLTGFRVTRVDQDLAARRVSVETRFVARLPSGDWKTICTPKGARPMGM